MTSHPKVSTNLPFPREPLSPEKNKTIVDPRSMPHKHFGHLDKDPPTTTTHTLPGKRWGLRGTDPFLLLAPCSVALLFVSLATGKGNPHLGGRGGPSNHTHRYTHAHMRPPTRNSVRHPPSALQPRAGEGAARQGPAGTPPGPSGWRTDSLVLRPRPALSVHIPTPTPPPTPCWCRGVGEGEESRHCGRPSGPQPDLCLI